MNSSGLATFLGRLRRDVRGNTLAIMAAAMLPLIALIGSGVDMTRAYMAENRLRQACDAGALAGRRLLTTTSVTSPVRDEATKYFAFNFPQGHFQAAPYQLAMSAPAPGTLRISTSSAIPTTIMNMFGFETLPISATCAATQDFINTDIMMVFDLSGSMNCPVNQPNSNCNEVNQPDSKLDALKDAARALYTTLEPAQSQLAANNLRLRYGFVNYSSGVNVGQAVYAKNSTYLVNRWNYQSRIPALDDSSRSQSWCNANDGVYYLSSYRWDGRSFSAVYSCRYPHSNGDTWLYRQTQHDVGQYLAGNRPYLVSRRANSSVWEGCIEERDTNNTAIDGGSSTTAPSSAYDLNVDLIPYNDATRWRPTWPDTEFARQNALNGSLSSHYCPTAARRLRNYHNNKASFDSYINGLRAIGGTYHDLGMIWGARFLSPTGIFAASPAETNDLNTPDNPVQLRGFGVKKYIIFMTDGDMSPSDTYSAYGIESLDRRVMGSNGYTSTDQNNRHLQRFRMACTAAKSKGMDIWVVAFATTLTQDMIDCATKPSQAAGLNDRAALIAKFQEIGSKIGSLRLSQ